MTLTYRFEHALIRQTLYDEIPSVRRLRLHRRIAEVLESLSAHAAEGRISELAYHYTEASRLEPTEKAVIYTRRAAESSLSVLAYEDAVTKYMSALESLDRISDHEGRTRAELLVALGDAQTRASQLVDARRTFLEAASTARRFRVPEAEAGAAIGFAALSAITALDKDAVDLLESALEALPAGDHPLRARVLARLANSLFLSGEDNRLDRISSDAVAMARRLDDPLVLAEALWFRHGCIRGPGVMPARLTVADEMVSLTRHADSSQHQLQGMALRLFDFFALGDMGGVDAEMQAMAFLVRDFTELGRRWAPWEPRLGAMRALVDGDLAKAEQLANESLVLSQQHEDPDGLYLYSIQLANIRREQDRAGDVTAGMRLIVEQSPDFAAWRCGLVVLLAEQGELAEAAAVLDGLALADFEVLTAKDDFHQVALTLLTDACVLLGDHERAEMLLPLLRPYGHENIEIGPALDCYGSAARAIGALATLVGDYDEADAQLRRAMEFNTRLGSRRWVAHTQIARVRMLQARAAPGDAAEANELLDAASETAAELGLAFVARQAAGLRRET